MTTANDQVSALLDELREPSRQAEKIFESNTKGHLQQRAGEKRWSAAEWVAHFNLTNRAFLSPLGAAIRELREKALLATGPFHLNWNARLLKYMLEPPSRLRLPTRVPFQPLPVREPEIVLREFSVLEKELDEKSIPRASSLSTT